MQLQINTVNHAAITEFMRLQLEECVFYDYVKELWCINFQMTSNVTNTFQSKDSSITFTCIPFVSVKINMLNMFVFLCECSDPVQL